MITIELRDANDDGELAGISHIVSVLERFDPPARERMLTYLCGRFPCERGADDNHTEAGTGKAIR